MRLRGRGIEVWDPTLIVISERFILKGLLYALEPYEPPLLVEPPASVVVVVPSGVEAGRLTVSKKLCLA